MELGEKLRKARLDVGMTQKQLSEGIVTRNMLSLIENGTATPSVKTLEAFAKRLGKSLSYFLEEAAVVSENSRLMDRARGYFDAGDFASAGRELEAYRGPDPVYDREKQLMEQLCMLEVARTAVREGKHLYAKALLEKKLEPSPYCAGAIKREGLLILGSLPGSNVSGELPSLDEELCIRAGEALRQGKDQRAAALLDACQVQEDARWRYLRGKCYLARKDYFQASRCLMAAEEAYPGETAPLLEICFRELGDYKQAYFYACRQK